MKIRIGHAELELIQGDITGQETDAIVNAANSTLMGGGGVDGAIHRRGGPRILEECRRIRAIEWPGGLPTGRAVITSGGNLKAEYVIHTVGPIWHGGGQGETELLSEAYRNSIALASARGLKTISFPSISTGAYGFPIERASRIALRTIRDLLEKESSLERVVVVLFSLSDLKVCEEAAREVFGISA